MAGRYGTARIVADEAGAATGLAATGLTVDGALGSYRLSLRAGNKSPATIKTYLAALASFSRFLAERGVPRVLRAIRREHVESFIVALQDAGQRPATVSVACRSLQPFFKWALGENEIETSPMERTRPAIVPEEPPAVLRETELKAIFDACSGPSFEDRRDTAIVRLLLDTGMRRAELAGLKVDDVDLDQQVAIVMGKGRRPRACPFGSKTAQALDRYLRVRIAHPFADREELWLAPRGALTDSGVLQILCRRGAQAGIPKLHPHQFRHTYAHMWLSDGGNEGDLLRLAGWKSRQMLSRYGASAADERARDAYRKRSPGDPNLTQGRFRWRGWKLYHISMLCRCGTVHSYGQCRARHSTGTSLRGGSQEGAAPRVGNGPRVGGPGL